MELYLAVAARSFRRATTYRSAYLAGIITNAFFGALVCFVYQALYAGGGRVAGLSLNDAISYAWTTQSLISIGGAWIVSAGISQSIRSGDVITDLSRPWSFYLYWLSRSFGERAFNLLVRGALTYLVGVLYFGARLPAPADLLAFLPAIILAMQVSFAFSFMVNLTAFWLLDSTGVTLLSNVMLTFLSGFILPVAFFPPALQALVHALPFESITGLPTQIFLGQLAPAQIARALATQAAWAAALTALGLAMQAAAMRKVVVQGG
ncbi:ABC-2 family transporter protein [Oscillochloris sp. ZM17-4]|uniref:ABC transporter permease n=1 Tax=Oscillochloris sp. ZM17-4 TaxID=2866714 RepID=UPI001C73D8EB|nr:ABC-2 family transporter protein [Oscillochloris sp. ZM17-4]MBX0326975.1 ABC-2 family transporter protein [Oscillochloris sp. ZM17-4]